MSQPYPLEHEFLPPDAYDGLYVETRPPAVIVCAPPWSQRRDGVERYPVPDAQWTCPECGRVWRFQAVSAAYGGTVGWGWVCVARPTTRYPEDASSTGTDSEGTTT